MIVPAGTFGAVPPVCAFTAVTEHAPSAKTTSNCFTITTPPVNEYLNWLRLSDFACTPPSIHPVQRPSQINRTNLSTAKTLSPLHPSPAITATTQISRSSHLHEAA